MNKQNVAVIGAGIFGSSAAIQLSRNGYRVDLFEKESDILQGASGINQYRLHRGYHYPRSAETIKSLQDSEASFLAEYKDAVINQHDHHYCIAKENSKTTPQEFLALCKKWNLHNEPAQLSFVNPNAVALVVKGKEALINPHKLKEIVLEKLRESGVNLKLNTEAKLSDLDAYDIVINCTYANLNWLSDRYPALRRSYQFELCEKPVLKLPEQFKGKSVVVLDGPFMCIDPYGQTDYHVMGNVVHAIHASNTGYLPILPEAFKPLINKGVIENPPITNIEKMIESASEFMPEIKKAQHIGSMYTFRTVLPDVDHTDERPTIVQRIDTKLINIFSGKIGNCVESARQVLALLEKTPN